MAKPTGNKKVDKELGVEKEYKPKEKQVKQKKAEAEEYFCRDCKNRVKAFCVTMKVFVKKKSTNTEMKCGAFEKKN